MSFLSRICGNFGIETSVKAARHAHIHCICGSIPNQMIYYLLFSAKFSLKHVHCACLLLPTIFHCNALHGELPNTCTYIDTNGTKLQLAKIDCQTESKQKMEPITISQCQAFLRRGNKLRIAHSHIKMALYILETYAH